ncbi:hypothetical protein BGZ80_001543 [Entomortierella chlamydospora]|uniref:Uncharacterized protein n=1 Tax=Entomortierella chlamydospora TaxID=101097 RepID=A0A9P6MRG8_9FUNG|nr:hypothetical protein BGZ80_001543 [Entomortierella chlamydospora]
MQTATKVDSRPLSITKLESHLVTKVRICKHHVADDNGNKSSTSVSNPAICYNLAVNQKADYQPTFKCRRWLDEKKRIVPLGEEGSISDTENRLPPLRGDGARFETCIKEFEQVQKRFDGFYNSDNMLVKKHQRDAQKAHDAKFAVITYRLLHMVGGSIVQQERLRYPQPVDKDGHYPGIKGAVDPSGDGGGGSTDQSSPGPDRT